MRDILFLYRKKLSLNVSLWLLLFSTLIFTAALGFLFYQSRDAVRQEAINRATQILDNTSLRVTRILNRVEVATNMTVWLVSHQSTEADSMFVYSKGLLLNNPALYNCSIAFEPYHFKEYGRYFSAYSIRDGDQIRTKQGGSDIYQYFYMDWYLLPQLLDRPCWTEPYIDYDVPSESIEMVTSYCQSIKDGQDNFIGVVNTSISLKWLSHTISSVKPYPHSYSIMIGRGGTYFVHPDSTKLTSQTIFTESMERPDTAVTALGYAMQRGEEGMKHMTLNGEDSYVFYKPLSDTGWSMAIVCPESDIFGGFDRLRRMVIAIVVVGLFLMLFLIIRIISRALRPLRELAKEAESIAMGRFDHKLPDYHREDEIGQLSQSFRYMQQSLVQYIEELKKTTTQKASIDNELRVASAIQMGMLPKKFPSPPERDDIDIYASLTPAREVGGDFFDFIIRDEKLFFCIGDVSGKGVPASLFMAVTRSIFRTVSSRESMPNRIVQVLNGAINEMNDAGMFVTLFVGVLDLPTGLLRYCNAGHDAPLLVGVGVGTLPVVANLPVGVMPDWEYVMQQAHIFTGTTIFLYTDGLSEAENASHELFRIERINMVAEDALSDQHQSPKNLIQSMSDAVHQFVGDAEQSDDLTMMAIQYNKQQSKVLFRRNIVLNNDIQEVPRLNAFVEEVCESQDFNPATTMRITLAIEEVVVNVINYGYPRGTQDTISVEAQTNEMRIKFTIIDRGMPFDPTTKSDADIHLKAADRPIGGLGIHVVRRLMDSMNYERIDGHNVLTLRKAITPDLKNPPQPSANPS